MAKSMFSGIGDARPPGERNYFNPGIYIVEVLSLEARDSGNVVLRARVVEVLHSLQSDGVFAPSNPVGDIAAVVYGLRHPTLSGFHLGRLRQVAEALLGPLGEGLADALDAIVATGGVDLKGQRLKLTALKSKAVKTGKPLTTLTFEPAPAAPVTGGAS